MIVRSHPYTPQEIEINYESRVNLNKKKSRPVIKDFFIKKNDSRFKKKVQKQL